MYTKADFQEAIANSIANYPTIAPLYHAGDPRIRQHLDAMAAMLAMFSSQLEVAQTEQYEKARDSTVLADAAMRGIIRKGRAPRARIRVKNSNSTPFTVDIGRNVIDSDGRLWRIETGAVIEAGGEGTFEASQRRIVALSHTVEGSEPFYAIQIPEAEDGSYLCGISVSDSEGQYEYRDRYVNTAVGERVFHVEADDRQNVYVRFGFKNVVATQPEDGDAITLQVSYTQGNVVPKYDSPLSFEFMQGPAESLVELKMDALLVTGEDPMSMSAMRDLAKYPSVYRSSAVFLGEFGFLVRRNFPTLQFLSVWNETIEEQARGASVDNINKLFVAVLSQDGTEKVLEETDPTAPVAPQELFAEDLTGTQQEIERCILGADNSYKVRFFTPVIQKIRMTIKARVSTSYTIADVRSKIRETLINAYGKEAAASRKGQQKPLYRDVYKLLREKVPALSDGEADLQVLIEGADRVSVRPETWCFLDAETLTIEIETSNIIVHAWGG